MDAAKKIWNIKNAISLFHKHLRKTRQQNLLIYVMPNVNAAVATYED